MSGLLLGFSGKMASGKSTTAKNILNKINNALNADNVNNSADNFVRMSFADALRAEVSQLMEYAKEVDSAKKFAQHELFTDVDERIAKKLYDFIVKDERNTRRIVMQTWGTNVRRASNENYWVNKAMAKADYLVSQGKFVALDDVRFDNEAEAILDRNGILIRLDIDKDVQIERLEKLRGKKVDENTLLHESETALDDYPYFSQRVDNSDNARAEEEIFNYLSFRHAG